MNGRDYCNGHTFTRIPKECKKTAKRSRVIRKKCCNTFKRMQGASSYFLLISKIVKYFMQANTAKRTRDMCDGMKRLVTKLKHVIDQD